MFKNKYLYNFFLSLVILTSCFFISSGRLSGDASFIFKDAFAFSYSWNYDDLKSIIPRRYAIFLYCFVPTQLITLIAPNNFYSELYYIIQAILSYSISFLWIMTIILTTNLLDRNFKKQGILIIVFYFFCTPIIFLSNEFVQENLIIFFISLFFYLEKLKKTKYKFLKNICLFVIVFLKIYFIPLVLLIIYMSKSYNFKEKIVTAIIITLSNILIFLLPEFFANLKSSTNTFIFVDNLDHYIKNVLDYFFSTNHGFFATYHIYSFIVLFLIIYLKYYILLSVNVFYILFFCMFPYWHGDMAGSRYMLPINFLNFCIIIPYFFSTNILEKTKNFIKVCIIFIWFFAFNTLDYDIASLNRYKDGVAYAKINNLNYQRKDLFNYHSFPYYSIELHPFIFASIIRIEKLFLNNTIVFFHNSNIHLYKKDVYPRTIWSVIKYANVNSKLVVKYYEKFLSSNDYKNIFNQIINVFYFISLSFIFCTPFFLVIFLRH
jgi:hypothetical protein